VGKNDELAKELREIHAIVSQNIKQNSWLYIQNSIS
jgi:hypothetical protein